MQAHSLFDRLTQLPAEHAALQNDPTMPLTKRLKKQLGFDMVQLGLVLVIIAIALVGIIVAYTRNSTSAQAQALGADLTTLIGNVKSAYAGNYVGVTNAGLSTGSFFKNLPSVTDTNGTVVVSLGGGTLAVTTGTVANANDSVQYVITSLPDAACLPLFSMLSKGVAYMNFGNAAAPAKGASGVVAANVTCTGDANTLTFKVR
jgi:type II secretory pathway pseudopilin PulG